MGNEDWSPTPNHGNPPPAPPFVPRAPSAGAAQTTVAGESVPAGLIAFTFISTIIRIVPLAILSLGAIYAWASTGDDIAEFERIETRLAATLTAVVLVGAVLVVLNLIAAIGRKPTLLLATAVAIAIADLVAVFASVMGDFVSPTFVTLAGGAFLVQVAIITWTLTARASTPHASK